MDKKFSIGGIIGLVVLLIVAFYMIAYTVPGAAGVISNSSGTWGAMTSSPGVFQLASIVVPLMVMVVFIMYLIKHASS